MADRCSCLLSKTYGHHLHDAALIGSSKTCMRLNPAIDNDSICLCRITADQNLHALLVNTDLHNFHAGLDRTAHGFLGDTELAEYFSLAFAGGAAVTAHGSHDKRLSTSAFHKIYNSLCDGNHIRNLAASHRNGNTHSRLDLRGKLFFRKHVLNLSRDCFRFHPMC